MAFMSDIAKIARVKSLVGNDASATTEVVSALLAQAADEIIGVMYPLVDDSEEFTVPAKYSHIQCELAARYFARMGANGEVTHNENGINRSWGSPDDADLLRKVTPIAKVY